MEGGRNGYVDDEMCRCKQHSQYSPILESENVAPLNCDSDNVFFRPALCDDYP